jgi:hypothetical protein
MVVVDNYIRFGGAKLMLLGKVKDLIFHVYVNKKGYHFYIKCYLNMIFLQIQKCQRKSIKNIQESYETQKLK